MESEFKKQMLELYKQSNPKWTAEDFQKANDTYDKLKEKYNFKKSTEYKVPDDYAAKLAAVPKFEKLDATTRHKIFWNIARNENPNYQVPERLHDVFRNIIADVFDAKGVLIVGGVGTGKTLLIINLQKAIKAEGKRLRLCSVPEIEQTLRMDNDADYSLWDTGDICFDDLGTENESNIYGNRVMVMTELIYRRYNRYQQSGLCTHFTTNLMPDEIKDKYGSRVHDRLIEMCTTYVLTGGSYRIK
jgi:DNA replication protein DnaC